MLEALAVPRADGCPCDPSLALSVGQTRSSRRCAIATRALTVWWSDLSSAPAADHQRTHRQPAPQSVVLIVRL